MNKLKTIIVGVDFSECSPSALEQAARMADFEKNHRLVLENNLREFVSAAPGISSIYAVTEAKTHGHGIAEYCRRIDADLVILGTKGKTNLKNVLLGSTVERLLKEIPCSALVGRPPVEP